MTRARSTELHRAVMKAEVLESLAPRPGGRYLDATLGLGGHAAAVLAMAGGTGELVGIERDPQALELAATRLTRQAGRLRLIHGRFESILLELAGEDRRFDGILFDLGVSSLQLDRPERGFSLRNDGPLDMRMDPGDGPTAADLLAEATADELTELLRRYGEERQARRIARRIDQERRQGPLERTTQLTRLIEAAIPRRNWPRRIHPATRTFQALRIAVNRELEGLTAALRQAFELLVPHGRLVVLSFHSLEDRPVKRLFVDLCRVCRCPEGAAICTCDRRPRARRLGRQPRRPTPEEIEANPRARSARLRAIRREPEP